MIIKSMSRKEASYNQLFDYMRHGANRDDDKYSFNHNCYGRKREDILREFEEQGNRLSNRKNGVYLYHEILSISRSKTLSEELQKELLSEIVHEYVKERAKQHLVSGFMHDEKDNNLHFHLMISSNEVGQSKRKSLRKHQFAEIKKNLEMRVLEKYPELEQKQLISKDNQYKDKKAFFKDRLQSIFSISTSREAFHQHLEDNKIAYSVRGQTITFINQETKKRHRLKTLGILEDYLTMEKAFSLIGEKPEPLVNDKPELENKKEKSTKENAKDPKSTQDNLMDSVKSATKEWVLGDFGERDQRIKEAVNKKIKQKYKEQNENDEKIKDKAFQTRKEVITEKAKELVLGDFSARDSRARIRKSENNLKQWREEQKEKVSKNNNHNKSDKGKSK